MGNRADQLEKVVLETQQWVAFAETDIWQQLKQRINDEVIQPATDAFHQTSIDGKSNDELIRNMMSQRSSVQTANKIIAMVESQIQRYKEAQKEIEKIDEKKDGKK